MTWLAGYIPRRHTRPETVTHPSTNRARRALTSFMRRTPLTTTPRSRVLSTRVLVLQQEALLPRTDRATRYVGRSLISCSTTLRTTVAINPRRIEVMELERYGRRTCNSNDASTVVSVAKLDGGRVSLTTRSTCRYCRGEIF